MTKYERNKARARQKAIDYQLNFCNNNYYTSEILENQNYFFKMAKRYGLIKELRENGII